MNAAPASNLPGRELFDAAPAVSVTEPEYRRLLGYPSHHTPGARASELAAWARSWFTGQGRPWVYVREAGLELGAGGTLRLDGTEFQSPQLHGHLRSLGARRAMLVAVSAGRECEVQASQLWEEAKPDEYFFLEMFGSAVVEQLVAATNGRVCDLAERAGLMALPHYSPGYSGWDVAEQNKLFALITGGASRPLPGPLEVLASGMLRPKKSLLAVIGLAPAVAPTGTRCAPPPTRFHHPGPRPRRLPARRATPSACARSASGRASASASRGGTTARSRRVSGSTARPARTPAARWRSTTMSRSVRRSRAVPSSALTAAPRRATTATGRCAPT